MTIRPRLVLVACAALSIGGAAQAQTDMFAHMRLGLANQIGILEFCRAQGHADADAIAAERAVLARMPPAPASAPSSDSAEALGRQGMFTNGTSQTGTLATMASAQNTTVAALCEQMSSALKNMGSGTGSAMGMPALQGLTPGPGLTGVPGMPPAR